MIQRFKFCLYGVQTSFTSVFLKGSIGVDGVTQDSVRDKTFRLASDKVELRLG